MPEALTAVRPELADLPQGWFNHGPQVLTLLERERPLVVVELGTWLGASAIAMARSVRRWGGTVTCIDTWAGELDKEGRSPEGRQPLMLWSAARGMVEAGVNASIRLIPASTREAAFYWPLGQVIDFLYIDADHSHAGVLADLVHWVPKVRRGGMMAGDDYHHPLYPGVATAWDEYARIEDLTLTAFQSTPPHPHGVELIYGRKD